MLDSDYADVERQLLETLNRLMQTTETAQKRTLLAHLRLLLMEADKLLEDGSTP